MDNPEDYGSDKEYQAWCRNQPSAYSGGWSVYTADGKGRNIYAHHRTAANSGTGYKPEYSGIPLTWREHTSQHQYGQTALASAGWWEQQRIAHLARWIAEKKSQKSTDVRNTSL